MNSIKGLILKDILQLKNYKKTLILFVIIFIIMSFLQENAEGIETMLIVMLTLGLGMTSIATFNYDEMTKADRYILILPVTRKDIVLSKYILVLLSTIIGALFGIICSVIICYIMYRGISNFENLVSLSLGSIFGIGTIEAIQIPCIFKYGTEKGRMQRGVVAGIIALLLGIIFYILNGLNISLKLDNLISIPNNLLPIVFILLTALVYFLSYKVSYSIYQKKEL